MVTCMKYEFVMYIQNAFFLNLVFGAIAAFYAHAARYGVLGSECAASQPRRAAYLTAEIVFFYILYLATGLFIYCFPNMAYELANNSW